MSTSSSDVWKHYYLAISALEKAVSDTEKFSALFVVSNVLKDKHLSREQNQHLFQTIDPKFLCRLLLSDGNSSEIPEGCPQYIYQSIGVSIISSFFIRIVDIIDIKNTVQLLSSMAFILRHLKDKQELDQNEKQVISDVITCFECFFSSNQIQAIDFQTKQILFETKFTQILFEMQSNHTFCEYKNSMKDLLTKTAILFDWTHFDPKTFDVFIASIIEEFRTNEGKQKFELCHTLSAIIIKNRDHFVKQTNNKSIDIITDTIFSILRNKLSKELRDPVLQLTATLTEIYDGSKWIYSVKGIWNEISCKNFLLLLRLSCIEIAVNLESEDLDMSCVANSFVILEHSIITVANDSEQMDLLKHLSQQEVYDMLTAIRDTMSVIIRYLQRFKYQTIDFDSESDVFTSILASIRVLCVWVTEETEALREEIADILPLILKIFKNNYENNLSINKPIITAMICLAEDDILKAILVNENLLQFLNIVSTKEPNNELMTSLKHFLQK